MRTVHFRNYGTTLPPPPTPQCYSCCFLSPRNDQRAVLKCSHSGMAREGRETMSHLKLVGEGSFQPVWMAGAVVGEKAGRESELGEESGP